MTIDADTSPHNRPIEVSVVIPVYQAQSTIRQLVQSIQSVLTANFKTFEIVLVDDSSTDLSWPILIELSQSASSVSAIRLAKNSGQHLATLVGVRRARGAVIVTLDDDFRHNPKDIPLLISDCSAAGGTSEVVHGVLAESRAPIHRRWLSAIIRSTFHRVFGLGQVRQFSSFRAIDGAVINRFHEYRGPNISLDVLLTWSTDRISFIEVPDSVNRPSRYSIQSLARYALSTSIFYSKRPLHVALFIGALLFLVSSLLLGVIAVLSLIGGSAPPGFITLALGLLLVSAVQFILIGSLSTYFAAVVDSLVGREYAPIQIEMPPTARPERP